jgi:predicted methyltransferase
MRQSFIVCVSVAAASLWGGGARAQQPAAGFELASESDLLANSQDDRSKMVFGPGTRGTTDQAVFVFRKPR